MWSLLLVKVQSEFCIFTAHSRGCFVVLGIIAYWQCTAIPSAVVCHVLYFELQGAQWELLVFHFRFLGLGSMHQNCHERFVCWPQVAIGREPLWMLRGLIVLEFRGWRETAAVGRSGDAVAMDMGTLLQLNWLFETFCIESFKVIEWCLATASLIEKRMTALDACNRQMMLPFVTLL